MVEQYSDLEQIIEKANKGYNFVRRLELGKIGETLYITYHSDEIARNETKNKSAQNKDYDFVLDSGHKVEVKTDFESYKTGNVAIEIGKYINGEQNPERGWFNYSEADYFIFYVVDTHKRLAGWQVSCWRNEGYLSCWTPAPLEITVSAEELRTKIKQLKLVETDNFSGTTRIKLMPISEQLKLESAKLAVRPVLFKGTDTNQITVQHKDKNGKQLTVFDLYGNNVKLYSNPVIRETVNRFYQLESNIGKNFTRNTPIERDLIINGR